MSVNLLEVRVPQLSSLPCSAASEGHSYRANELVENSSLLSYSLAWTQGLLTVRTTIRWEDWMTWTCLMICLFAVAMARALISHGSQVTWCLHSFTAKNPEYGIDNRTVSTVWSITRLGKRDSLVALQGMFGSLESQEQLARAHKSGFGSSGGLI